MGKSCAEGEEVGMGANPAQCPLCSGLQALGQTFGANPAFASSLRYLDLSKNPGLLATDEANVSPQNRAQARQKHAQASGPGSLCPVAWGQRRSVTPSLAAPLSLFAGPLQFPGPAQCSGAPGPGRD